MKKILLLAILSIVLFISCTDNSKNKMSVQGEVIGLKKGTLYLQKIENGVLSTVDSTKMVGSSLFALESSINTAELHFLSLDKNNEMTIPFFGEVGTITINTNLDNFVLQAKISGSKNQDILENYNKISSKFQDQNLDMIKEDFEAQVAKDKEKLDVLAKKSKQLLRRKYLYTTNFAIMNADSEVAPYLALKMLADANIKLLDTINKSLTEKIKNSSYGKELNSFVEKIKQTEKE
tara:strand:+ start:9660 stop:10364 length:705 start_codon:yes stop_codon:yes gene_type:complete